MLDVDQNYGTPETPKPFHTFKECVAQDVQNVIFNSNEHQYQVDHPATRNHKPEP